MIYLDNASTTKMDAAVLNAMLPYMKDMYGNAGTLHALGRDAASAVRQARQAVADFVGARPEQIIFTSGGSEANNLALIGIKDYLTSIGKKRIIMSAIEHDSVINAGKSLIKDGFRITYIHPDKRGVITCEAVDKLLAKYDDVGLLSVMAVNNETGIINEVSEIGRVCKSREILFHTDCVQAAGCYDISVGRLRCDLLSISSHKIHGPKGVGALYVRDKRILVPLIYGGSSQEFGFRAGTENVPGIVGFGEACRLSGKILHSEIPRLRYLVNKFISEVRNNIPEELGNDFLKVNGDGSRAKAVNIQFRGVDAETLLLMLDALDVYVSAGSACRSHESEPSRVLLAMGLSPEEARSSIRVSLSKYSTEEDVKSAASIIAEGAVLLSNVVEKVEI